MLRLILAISLIILSASGSYYFLNQRQQQAEPPTRPAISSAKEAAIAKRAEQNADAVLKDIEDQEAVIDLERYFR